MAGLGQTYTNAERPAMRDSHGCSDDRTPQRAQAQPTPVRSAVAIFTDTGRCVQQAGTFDDTIWLDPKMHVYCDSNGQWTPMPDGSKVIC
jgi:hypothetical protein